MAIINSIVSGLKKFSGKPLGYTSKVLGAAAVATVIYDSHVNGVEKGKVTDELDTVDRFTSQYSQYMKSPKDSATICALKKKWFDWQQDFSLNHPISKAKGYTKGFLGTAVSELPVLALSVLALATKGVVSKVSGVLLALNAVKTLFVDVFGFGARK